MIFTPTSLPDGRMLYVVGVRRPETEKVYWCTRYDLGSMQAREYILGLFDHPRLGKPECVGLFRIMRWK